MTRRAFSCATAALAVGLGALGASTAMASPRLLDAPDTLGPLDLRGASVTQQGPALVAIIRLGGRLDPRRLPAGSGVCLDVGARSVCVHRVRRALRAYLRPSSRAAPAVDVLAAGPTRIVLRVPLRAAGVRPGTGFQWSVRSIWRADERCRPLACGDRMPDTGQYPGQTRRFGLAGCSRAGPPSRSAGSRRRRVVALTFDDGPGPYTGRMLDVLERHRVPATFFVVGRHVRAHPRLARRALAAGFPLGDHTWSHANVARGGPFAGHEISLARRAIRSATGYRPCLFRAPYGAVSRGLVAEAARATLTTIGWDVDPRDWSRPGAAAIHGRVMSRARPGSIILLHDAGGPRGQTLAALPRIIRSLRARGYGFVTVPELLGFRSRYHYRPGVRPRGAPTRLRSDGARPLR